MSLREEMRKYEQITGESAEHVPIIKLGAFLDGYEMGIKALEQIRWIPVSKRMPDDGQGVLFCDIDEDVMIGYHVKGRPDTHFTQQGTYDDIKNVIAWMPLPESYKEENNETDN